MKRGRGRPHTAPKKAKSVKMRPVVSSAPSKFAGKTFFDPKAAAIGEDGGAGVGFAATKGRVLSAPALPAVISEPVAGFVEVDGALWGRHEIKGCPGCKAPAHIQGQGWPVPCPVRVSEWVECRDTAAAQAEGHHHECTYWDHYPERTPF